MSGLGALKIKTAAAFLLLTADQAAKFFARSEGSAVANYGVSFSVLADHPHAALALSVFASLVCLGYLVFAHGRPLGLFVIASGVVGNLIDRLLFGHVIDWIHIPFAGIAVNLADVWICAGCLLTLKYLKKDL